MDLGLSARYQARMSVLILLVACGSEPDEPTPSDDSTYLRGTYRQTNFLPWEGIEVCVDELPDLACELTDDDGNFLLEGLPLEADVTVRPHHADVGLDTYHPHHTADFDNTWNRALITQEKLQDAAEDLGSTLDAGAGHFAFVAITDFPDWALSKDVSFTLDPDPGQLPYYGKISGSPDPDLTATGSAGSGGMANIAPGDYAVQFTGPGGPCRRIASWDFPEGEPVPVSLHADGITYMEVICPPAE